MGSSAMDVAWVRPEGWFGQASVDQYRCDLPARYLPGRGVVVDPMRFRIRPLYMDDEVTGADVTVWWYVGDRSYLEAQRHVQTLGRLVVLEADDNHLAELAIPDTACLERPGMVVDRERVADLKGAYRESLAGCDGVIVSTPTLAETIRELGLVDRIWVCRNAVDPADWPASPPARRGRFTVGFGGSTSHLADVQLVRDAVTWVTGRPDAEAVALGVDPRGESLTTRETWYFDARVRDFRELLRGRSLVEFLEGRLDERHVRELMRYEALKRASDDAKRKVLARRSAWSRLDFRHVPWTDDLAIYRRVIGGVDVLLCPLIPDDFSVCRSDCKVLEAAMAGALPIVSDLPPYEPWRDTPVLFASNPAEFLGHVQWAVSHRDEVRERAMAVREIVLRDRAMPAAVEPWRRAFAELGARD